MEKIWIVLITISLFLISTFLIWRITANYRKKEYGKKMWKLARIYYWQSVIFVSTGVTFLIMFLFNWANILTF